MKFINKLMVILLAALMLIPCAACKKDDVYEVPEGLNREEAAMFTAVAAVCPKNDNHSKVEYLTFHIKGWSFDEIPDAIQKYLAEYAANGNAAVVNLSFDELVSQGYLAKGDGDFFGEDELTYKEGKGKIFTFELTGDANSDTIVVKLMGFISENDQSGYDINMTFKDDKWVVDGYSNPWGAAYMQTPDPNANGTAEPEK